jgi:hypothetical protein
MKVLSIAELLCLTRMELLELRRTLELQIVELQYGSVEWHDTHVTLANLRIVLIRCEISACHPSP